MPVIHLDSSNFDSTIAGDKLTLVDFWAPWCGPCRMLGPTIDALANEVTDKALVCKLNVDESPEIAERFGVSMIPTIIFFKKGERLVSCGGKPKEELLEKIKELA